MILLMYHERDDIYVGVKAGDGIIRTTVKASTFFERGWAAYQQIQQMTLDISVLAREDAVRLAPAVPNPGKIVCVGLNYRKHAIEAGFAIPEYPILFSKYNNSIAASNENVPISPGWTEMDYEAELVVVMGRSARNVSVEDALDYVLGYCNGNDISSRALQFRSSQWMLGKIADKSLPLGPYLVTADSLADPQNLSIKGWLNGELRQDSNTSDMIFSVAEIVSYTSQYIPLEPGDIISTGTPEGVIQGYPEGEKHWLKPGDEYKIEIEGLGILSNTFVEG